MKSSHLKYLLGLVASTTALSQPAHAQFNTLELFGDANNTTPPAGYTSVAGTIVITAGGSDFWNNSDNGAFLWDNTNAQTTTGDFTATVRHISTTHPAPEYGRDGIMARATQSDGVVSSNDAYWMASRRSAGLISTNRRSDPGGPTGAATDIDTPNVNFSSLDNERGFATGSVTSNPYFLSAGRYYDEMHTGYALDLGGGVAGRFVKQWSTTTAAAVANFAGGKELVVGLGHQSHPQTIEGTENDINTATFDKWLYSGTFDATKFGPPAGSGWTLGGSVRGDDATGEVLGSAYVDEGGSDTNDPVKWTLQVYPASSYSPSFGTSGTRRDPTPMTDNQTVPTGNFRVAGEGSAQGLKADIYLNTNNGGNLSANLALIANPLAVKATVTIPNVYWSSSNYPKNEQGENLFAQAHPGQFSGDQSFYGVDLTGQIFIPADADRVQPKLPGEFVVFKDGNDDFTYLEIDGKVLINDNDYTTLDSTANLGGNVTVLDVSDPKYNDGEWVSFRMIAWEGEGGDNAALYWDQNAAEGILDPVFTVNSVPGTFGNLVPLLGVDNSRKDPGVTEPADVVPAADFRHTPEGGGSTVPGLKADIYNGGNPGNLTAIDAIIQGGSPASSVILPNINWWNSAGGVNYPSNGGTGNLFGDAGVEVEPIDPPAADPTIIQGVGYRNYGVNMTGEIFIPADGTRHALPVAGGNNLVLFKDGVDDFTYLEIDGQILINDNIWTGPSSTENGGGNVSLLDVSAAKYDDGEWVPFRMTTWEGGGGDSGVLYWSARDNNGTFGVSSVPGSTAPSYELTGTNKVGTAITEDGFGLPTLPPGDWVTVLKVENTGASLQRVGTVSRAAAPGAAFAVTSFSYNPATTILNLGFSSEDAGTYALEYTIGFQAAGAPTNVQKWNVVPGYTAIDGQNGTTTITPLNVGTTLLTPAGLLPDMTKAFFRVRRLP